MNTFLTVVGAITVVLGLLGALGIGNFVFMYSPDKISCTKEKI